MDKRITIAAVVAVLFSVMTLGMLAEATGNDAEQTVPRYSEVCAHGHNGFGCDMPQYKSDIAELQKRTADLEERIFQLERR